MRSWLLPWQKAGAERAATEEQIAFANKVQEASDAANAAAGRWLERQFQRVRAGSSRQGGSLDYFRDMLNGCYDESGHLKEGMEATAEYALELNTAMGTDYSTEGLSLRLKRKQALEDINGAIDQNIEKLKQQAIAQAFQKDILRRSKRRQTHTRH